MTIAAGTSLGATKRPPPNSIASLKTSLSKASIVCGLSERLLNREYQKATKIHTARPIGERQAEGFREFSCG
jgi:hypothetical protein